jgi:hypothetical protein
LFIREAVGSELATRANFLPSPQEDRPQPILVKHPPAFPYRGLPAQTSEPRPRGLLTAPADMLLIALSNSSRNTNASGRNELLNSVSMFVCIAACSPIMAAQVVARTIRSAGRLYPTSSLFIFALRTPSNALISLAVTIVRSLNWELVRPARGPTSRLVWRGASPHHQKATPTSRLAAMSGQPTAGARCGIIWPTNVGKTTVKTNAAPTGPILSRIGQSLHLLRALRQ